MSDTSDDESLAAQTDQVPENRSNKVISTNAPGIETPKQEIKNMEVHHHPDLHHKKKNFKEYFLEFLMIFLAVTMGFFAESYREHSVEKARAKEYANSFVHDLEKDTAMVQIDINQMKLLNSKIDSLANFLRNKEISEISNKQLFAYTVTISGGVYRPYTWSRATLEQIKGSGSLRYFANDSIIMRISAYDALTRHMDQDFNGDVALNDRASEKRNYIIDINYDLPDSVKYSHLNADSIINIINDVNHDGSGDLRLLTSNINDIKSLLNDYLNIRLAYYVRGKQELPHLVNEAAQLITMLQQEYNLNDE
jgi:hypothetical protein